MIPGYTRDSGSELSVPGLALRVLNLGELDQQWRWRQKTQPQATVGADDRPNSPFAFWDSFSLHELIAGGNATEVASQISCILRAKIAESKNIPH
jgi:hypothetical protein